MNKFLPVSGFAVLACVALALNAKAQIKSEYEAYDKALKSNDANAFKSMMDAQTTPDFVYVENGQKLDEKTVVQQVAMSSKLFKSVDLVTSKILTYKETSKEADVSVLHVFKATTSGKDNKTHSVSFQGVSKDVWVPVSGQWKMSSMTWGKQTMLMDGKPFDPAKSSAN